MARHHNPAQRLPIAAIVALGVSLAPSASSATATTPGTGTKLAVEHRATSPSDDGDEQYRFLVGLIDKGMFEMAVREATTFLREHGDHEKAELARYRLATALFELERPADAAPHYEELARSRGFEYAAESAFRLGQCQLAADTKESIDASARSFARVLELGQDYLIGPARFFLAEAEFRRDNLDEAAESYQLLIRRHSDSEYVPGARRGLVWCAWQARDVEPTVRRARAYLEHHAEDDGADEVRVLLGEALLEGERPEEALAAFRDVRGAAFGDAGRRGAGFALAAIGNHEEAAQEFAYLLRDFPASRFGDEATLQVGVQTLRAGDTAGAVRALRVASRSGDPQALYWQAQAEHANEDFEQALRTLDEALKREPSDTLSVQIQVARGDALHAMGRTQDALAAYESGGSEYSLYAAGVAAMERDDHATAVRMITRLFHDHPETSYRTQALLVLGEAHFGAGDLAEAERVFANVLEDDDVSSELASQAQNRLAWCAYLAGDLGRAADRFAELDQRFPNEAAAEEGLYMLGRVLVESNGDRERERARTAHKRYLSRYPEGAHRDEVLFAAAQIAEGAEGVRTLEALLDEHGSSDLAPRALLDLGDRLSASGDVEGAAERYTEVLREHRGSDVAPQAAYGLGWCRYQSEQHEGAAELLEQLGSDGSVEDELRIAALELAVWARTKAADPQAATRTWKSFARLSGDDGRRFAAARTVVAAWRDAGRPAEGQRVLDELLSLADDEAVAVDILIEGAYLALEEGDVERADAQVQVARRRAAEAASVSEAAFFVGEARFGEGNSRRAIALYTDAAAENSPVRANALYKLGFTLLRTEELEEAHAAFRAVVDGFPRHELFGESLFLAGETLFRLDRFEESIRAFERLRHDAPDHEVLPKALFRQGVACGRLERWSDCEAALTRLAQRAPEFENLAEAELWRGRALAAQRKGRAARQAFDRVVANDKGQLAAQARIGIGRLHEAEGRADEALSEYLKVSLLYAHSDEVSEALFRAGNALETLGDPEKAAAQYEELLREHPESRFADLARKALDRTRSR